MESEHAKAIAKVVDTVIEKYAGKQAWYGVQIVPLEEGREVTVELVPVETYYGPRNGRFSTVAPEIDKWYRQYACHSFSTSNVLRLLNGEARIFYVHKEDAELCAKILREILEAMDVAVDAINAKIKEGEVE